MGPGSGRPGREIARSCLGLTIGSLDLRSCPVQSRRVITLPGLSELHVEAGRSDLSELRRMIRSDKPLKIIEHRGGR